MLDHWLEAFIKDFKREEIETIEDLIEVRNSGSPFLALNVDLPRLKAVHTDVVMRSPGDTPSAEIYIPESEATRLPVFMHIHGGAWFSGSAVEERKLAMQIAAAGFVVVNINYSLAPERPFPRGLEDCIYAARWIANNISTYSGDPDRLVIGGGSAGGNLTVATILALHGSDDDLDGGDLADVPVKVAAAVPQFGVFNAPMWLSTGCSYEPGLEVYYQAYLGPSFRDRLEDPRVSPAFSSDLALMPPTYLSCGAHDCLLDNSFEMTKRLAQLDVPTTLSVVEGADHEFLKLPLPTSHAELRRITCWSHAHLP